MLRKLFFASLLMLTFTVFSQGADSSRWAVGFVFSPDNSYRIITYDDPFFSGFRQYESPKLGVTTGFSMLYKLSSRLNFESGLLYANKGEKYMKQDLLFGDLDSANISALSVIYHYKYLDIPFKLNYYTGKKRKFFISAGLAPSIFLRHTTTRFLKSPDGTIEKKKTKYERDFFNPLNIIHISAMAGFGFDFNIKDKGILRIEPVFRQAFTPIANAPVNHFPNSLGLNMGLFYRL